MDLGGQILEGGQGAGGEEIKIEENIFALKKDQSLQLQMAKFQA